MDPSREFLGGACSQVQLNRFVYCVYLKSVCSCYIRPKTNFCLVPVSDRPCQFMCDPNYFMSKMQMFDANYNYVLVQHLFILYKDERIFSFLNENNLPIIRCRWKKINKK
ncbi:unnamed protein product [Arctogadus glacialis]